MLPPSHRRLRPVVALVGAVVALAVLLPILAAPVWADDRYWYLEVPVQAQGSVLEAISWTWREIPSAIQTGRLAPLASLARRIVSLGVTQLSLSTGLPLVVFVGVLRLVLLLACIGAAVLLVATLRARTASGTLVRARRSTLWLVAVLGTLLTVAGVQAQGGIRNGWTAYPTLTYGCLLVTLLVVSLAVAAARWVHARPVLSVLVVPAMLVVAVLLCGGYELAYAAVPAAAVALLLQPVGAGASRWQTWRARLLVGGPLVGGFVAGVVATRVVVARICAERQCYAGVDPAPGLEMLRTFVDNLLSATPAFTGVLLREDLRRVDWLDRLPVGVTGWSIAAALTGALVVAAAWWLGRPSRPVLDSGGATDEPPDEAAARRPETRLLLVGAAVLLVVAVVPAAIMSISVAAQELVAQAGTPYRSTVMTWVGASFAVACLAAAVRLHRQPVANVVTVVVLAAATAVPVALVLPRNLLSVEAVRAAPTSAAVEDTQSEAVRYDPTPAGDRRRCAVAEVLLDSTVGSRDRIVRAADRLYQSRFGLPFCSRLPSLLEQ